MPVLSEATNYVTPISPILPTAFTQVLPEPPVATDSMINLHKHYVAKNPFRSHLKLFKTQSLTPEPYTDQIENDSNNVTNSSAADIGSYKATQTESSMIIGNNDWPFLFPHTKLTGSDSYSDNHPIETPDLSNRYRGGNIVASSVSDIESPKTIQVEPHMTTGYDYWPNPSSPTKQHDSDPIPTIQTVQPVIFNAKSYNPRDNISVLPVVDTGSSFKTIQDKLPIVPNNYYWPDPLSAEVENKKEIETKTHKTVTSVLFNNHTENYHLDSNNTDFAVSGIVSPFKTTQTDRKNIHTTFSKIAHSHPQKQISFVMTDNKVRNIVHPVHELQDQFSDYQDRSKSFFKSHEVVKKLPSSSSVKDFSYFVPTHQKNAPPPPPLSSDNYPPKTISDTFITPTNKYFFQPILTNKSDYILTKSDPALSNSFQDMNLTSNHTSNKPPGKHVTILKTKILNVPKPSDAYDSFWPHDTKTHVLTKLPNPYETVLLRAVQNPKHAKTSTSSQKLNSLQVPSKPYSAIDLEHLLNQMEVQSEVNRNLGRSADKNQGNTAGQ